LLGLEDRGRIEPGMRADLLVVEGDPTADLGALLRVRHVIAGGRLMV
jgi:imidazolonepropionase-like amidohydrolase